jgi:hypothetical protein
MTLAPQPTTVTATESASVAQRVRVMDLRCFTVEWESSLGLNMSVVLSVK